MIQDVTFLDVFPILFRNGIKVSFQKFVPRGIVLFVSYIQCTVFVRDRGEFEEWFNNMSMPFLSRYTCFSFFMYSRKYKMISNLP